MRSIRHPLSGALYDLQTDGTVRVEKDGKSGTFRADGSYVSGDIYSADPQMCVWVGGRELGSRVRPRSGSLIPAKNS
jgi:non-ribosomal peptide synthetase component E (peptide arylation enzyme)